MNAEPSSPTDDVIDEESEIGRASCRERAWVSGHTRWPRDWSSDVCSSDLERELNERRAAKGLPPIGKKAEEARERAKAQEEKPKGQRPQPVRKPRKKR